MFGTFWHRFWKPSSRRARLRGDTLSLGPKLSTSSIRARRARPRVEPLEERVVLDALHWVGGGMDNNWSTDVGGVTNWFDDTTMTGVDAVPHNGDDLTFNNTATGTRVANNDLTNLQVNSITIAGDNYFITGNALTLTGAAGLTFNAPTIAPILQTDLVLNTSLSFTNNGAEALVEGNLDLNGNALTIMGTGSINISAGNGRGIISSSVPGDSLTKTGTGTLFLEGANTFDGPLTISNGIVADNNDTGLGSGLVTVLSGATLKIGQLTQGFTVPENVMVAGTGFGNSGAIVSFDNANTLTGTITLTADTTVSIFSEASLTIQGPITGMGNLTLIASSGAGPLILSGLNTYQGGTIITSGTLQAGAANVIPMGSDVTLTAAGAAFNLNNFNQTIGSLAGVDGSMVTLGSATLTVGASNIAMANFAGTISGSGGLTKVGTGIESLTGSAANPFSGETMVLAGTLVLGKPAGVPALGGNVVIGVGPGTPNSAVLKTVAANQLVSTAIVMVTSSGLFDLQSGGQAFGELSGFGNVTLDSAGSQLTVGDNGVGNFGGTISEPNGPSGGLIKIGAGAQVLGGRNTYTGPTLVTSGTLLVNGSLTASPVSLTGGLLTGSGTLDDVTATGGTLAPGVGGVGLMTVHNLTLNAATTFRVALNGTTPGLGFGQLIITGTVNLGNSMLLATLNFMPPANASLAIIKSNEGGTVQGTFSNLAEGQSFTISGHSFLISYHGGSGNDVVLKTPQVVTDNRLFVIGGAPGRVQVRRVSDGSLVADFAPYGSTYTGPISVAVGDVNGDGFPDIITGAKVGNPDVRVYDGKAFSNGTFDVNNSNASLIAQFFPYALQFNVGVNVAVGDIEHNGFADIVTGATAGNPDVRVYRGKDIAMGTFNSLGASLIAQFFPYSLQFNVGAFVAVGDTTGSGFGDIITGASSGNPDVRVFRGQDIAQGKFQNSNPSASQLTQFFAYALNFNVGAAVASAAFETNGHFDILTGASSGTPHYRVVKGNATGTLPSALFEGIPNDLQGGISVGA